MSDVRPVPPPEDDVYEVYAIKYAELSARPASHIFVGADPHERDVDMDYFVWAIRGERSIVVDTGFTRELGENRDRTFLRCPGDALRALGVAPETVADVIITHLHYDHFGNAGLFPNARFHIQDREMAYATGRFMPHAFFGAGYEEDNIVTAVRANFAGRLVFHDGDGTVAPGVTVHLAGGHTAGLQFVRVATRNGWLILASDAAHYHAHRKERRVFPIVYDASAVFRGYDALERMASADTMIIPGHDPAVMADYPAAPGLDGVAVRLD